jgi:diadenylate cyclase
VRFQVSELGKDGRLLSLQLGEVMAGIPRQRMMLIQDYVVSREGRSPDDVIADLEALTADELMDDSTVTKTLGYSRTPELANKVVRPRGYRILSMLPRLPMPVIENIISRFENLKNILRAGPALLNEVEGVGERRAVAIKEGLDRIAESIIMESFI